MTRVDKYRRSLGFGAAAGLIGNPPSCNQPGVSGADYVRVFAEVGGGRAVWVTS